MASVASRNLFDILADNEDIESVVPEKEPTPKENVVVQKKVDRSRASPKEARIRHEYPQRGGFKPSPPNSRNEETRSGAPRDRNVGPRLYNRREEGGGDYPGRNSRGARASERGRGARGGGGRRGREYDRHSGTGKYDSHKKETQGWGNPSNTWENNEAIETQNNGGEADANTNTNTSAWGDQPSDNNAGEGWAEPAEGKESGAAQDSGSGWEESAETAAPEEEVVATNGESAPAVEQEEAFKTLDEYRAEKPQKTVVATLPEARKPNEGVDDSQWKDAVPLEKDEEEDVLFAGKEHSYRLKSKKTKAKNFIEIEQTFVEKPGPGYPRGRGRGRSSGPRGRGDRRENRDGRDNYEGENRRRNSGGGRGSRTRGRGDYVNLDDQRAFPSLGAA